MKQLARLVSAVALVATILPSVLFFVDRLSLAEAKTWMLGSALLWFLSAPFWMGLKPSDTPPDQGAAAAGKGARAA